MPLKQFRGHKFKGSKVNILHPYARYGPKYPKIHHFDFNTWNVQFAIIIYWLLCQHDILKF